MGHTYANILLHVIFATKNRTASIAPDLRPRLYEYLGGVARKEFGPALEIGGTADHLHALISLNRDVSIADAMRKWKSLSSGWVHKTFSNHQAFSVSESNADAVRAYIAGQEEHHRHVTFEEEFRAFLDRHGLSYDPDHTM